MSSRYCFLCATNEGVFLDINTENRQIFRKQFEICSLVKVPTIDQLPTNICHKCAYELQQCSSFVQRYKYSPRKGVKTCEPCCNLCFQFTNKEYIFDLSRDKKLKQKSLDRIQKVFNDDVKKRDCKFICLSCCYTVDLLLDLKNVSQEIATKLSDIIPGEIDYSNFPKIKTTVLSRKTTITESARTTSDTIQDTDREFKTMTRTRSQNNKLNNNQLTENQRKSQMCDNCHSYSQAEKYIYKILKTGNTVCQSCWMKLNVKIDKVEKQQNIAETRSCKVFLKDVLKDTALKEQKLYKIEENDQGKKTYTVTEKDSAKESKSCKVVSDTEVGSEKQGTKRPIRNLRSGEKDDPNKKLKSLATSDNADFKQSASKTKKAGNLKQETQTNDSRNMSQSSDSDSVVTNRYSTRQKRASGSSLSDADVDTKRDRKRLKTILAGNIVLRNVDKSDDSSSDEEKRKKRRFIKDSVTTIDLTKSNKSDIQESTTITASSRKARAAVQKLPKCNSLQESQTSAFNDTDSTNEKNQLYICRECLVNYENKFECLTHQLTHYKQPKLELERVVIDNVVKKTLDLSEAKDDQCEDQSETIAIRVDDDEEETIVDVNNLNETEHIQINFDKEDKTPSKKELGEDATNVELVMKESDDDQSQLDEKKTKETQEDENAKAVVIKSPNSHKEQCLRRSTRKVSSRRGKSGSSSNNNNKSDNESICEDLDKRIANLEENQDISLSHIEDVEKEENKKEKMRVKDENREKELRVEGEDKEEEVQVEGKDKEEELQVEGKDKEEELQVEGKDKEEEVQVERKDKEEEVQVEGKDKEEEVQVEGKDKEEEVQVEGKDKEEEVQVKGKDKEEDVQVEGEDKKKELRVEREDKKEKKIVEVEDKEKERRMEPEDKEKERRMEPEDKEKELTVDGENKEEGGRIAEEDKELEQKEVEEKSKDKEKEVVCIEKASEILDKEEANKFKDIDDNILNEDETDASKVAEQHETKKKDTEKIDNAKGKTKDIEEVILITDTKNIESNDSNGNRSIQINSDTSLKSETVTGVILPKEIVITSEDEAEVINVDAVELNTFKRKESTNDSANVAAEVLQEVLDLASAEVQNRREAVNTSDESNSVEAETLENISREIQNSVDMPSLKLNRSTERNGNDSE